MVNMGNGSKTSIFFTLLGGYRPFLITNALGEDLWGQYSQGPESMRPYFLIPGAEKRDLVREICKKMDSEAEGLQTFDIQLDGTTIKVNVQYHLALDGKLIEMTTGLRKI